MTSTHAFNETMRFLCQIQKRCTDNIEPKPCLCLNGSEFGGVLKSMLTLNEAIIDVKEG